jgi:hypothetical protein
MTFENFEELQNVCGDCNFSNFGLVCDNPHNPTHTQGTSWGNCTSRDCPLIERKVIGSVYIDGEKSADITAIKFS